jgi:hypothetical protein
LMCMLSTGTMYWQQKTLTTFYYFTKRSKKNPISNQQNRNFTKQDLVKTTSMDILQRTLNFCKVPRTNRLFSTSRYIIQIGFTLGVKCVFYLKPSIGIILLFTTNFFLRNCVLQGSKLFNMFLWLQLVCYLYRGPYDLQWIKTIIVVRKVSNDCCPFFYRTREWTLHIFLYHKSSRDR